MRINRKYITAIATLAAVLVMGAMLAFPVVANDKADVCHWASAHGQQGWGVIDISVNTLGGHLGKHTDGELFDSLLNENFDASDCDSRNQ
jgi:hypothetical protein